VVNLTRIEDFLVFPTFDQFIAVGNSYNDYIDFITLYCINRATDTNRRGQGVSQGTEDGQDYVFGQYGCGSGGDVCRSG